MGVFSVPEMEIYQEWPDEVVHDGKLYRVTGDQHGYSVSDSEGNHVTQADWEGPITAEDVVDLIEGRW